jgi:hypothetical protein
MMGGAISLPIPVDFRFTPTVGPVLDPAALLIA